MPTIVFNGKSYNSLEEIPAQERQAYEQLSNMFVDKNGNGIPDFLEGDIVKNVSSFYNAASNISFNGSSYNNLSELPPDVQEKIKTAFNKISGMGLVSQNDYEEHTNKHTIHNEAYVKSTPFISREYNPVIEEESNSNFKTWLLAGIVIMGCLGVIAIAIFAFMFL